MEKSASVSQKQINYYNNHVSKESLGANSEKTKNQPNETCVRYHNTNIT